MPGAGESPALAAKVTPAMASGLTDHVWTLEEVVGLLDQTPAITRERGSSPQPHSGRVSTTREPLPRARVLNRLLREHEPRGPRGGPLEAAPACALLPSTR